MGSLASKMGPAVKRYTSSFLADILNHLADAKEQTRRAAMDALEDWSQQVGIDTIIDGDWCGAAIMQSKNANLRKDLFEWICNSFDQASRLPDLKNMIKPCWSCLEDRNGDSIIGDSGWAP